MMNWPKQGFGVDLRALALLRIGIGATVTGDLLFRLTELTAHYCDSGVLPRELVFDWNSLFLSLHFFSGKWEIQLLLFLVSIFFGLKLIIGKDTRITTIILWVLTLSLHNRNLFVLQGGDDYLSLLLFWGIFLPWGKVWSFDARNADPLKSFGFSSLGSMGYILQICLMYVATGFHKVSAEWTTDWTALYFTFQLDQYANVFGKWLLNFPMLLKATTIFVLWLERVGWLLLVLPSSRFPFKSIGVVLFGSFHFMIGITMMIGIFPVIGCVALLGLLPPKLMDRISSSGTQKFLQTSTHKFRHIIADNFQIKFGEQKTATTSTETTMLEKRYLNGLIVCAIVFSIVWNIEDVTSARLMPNWIRETGVVFRLDQRWRMFSPDIKKDDGWFVMEARLKNGNMVDIFQDDGKLEFAKPESVLSHFKKARWRKFLDNWKENDEIQSGLPAYLCSEWNNAKTVEEQVDELRIVFMEELLVDYQEQPVLSEKTLMTFTPN